ncbi:uncharacterized protein LOC130942028 [Arachis stenosperma]|uniref:uncharacterized protein LOC130942028 n=1 Tax=Arachis stenosperma TaxID=217475 RepID=UPI0025AB69A5|nr:uncharacterized protein LOC130942028 [Arachis stenosperma]
MPTQNSYHLNQKRLWRFVGFMSYANGFLCYAKSSSFKHLFGEWNLLKIILYTLLSFSLSTIMLFPKKCRLSRSFLLKAYVGVLVLLLTSLYSFFSDKSDNGKPDLLSMISNVSFALMSLSLSRQIDLGFEAELLNFFLGCLTIQLMKISLMLSIVAAIFCYSLMILRSKSESQSHVRTLRMQDHVTVDIDAANDDYLNAFQWSNDDGKKQMQDDGYSWRKYEENPLKRRGNQISFYRCSHPNCKVKKKVERTIGGEIIHVNYKGTHAHRNCKPKFPIKRNSSSESFYSLLPSEPSHTKIIDQSLAFNGDGQLDHDTAPESSSLSI